MGYNKCADLLLIVTYYRGNDVTAAVTQAMTSSLHLAYVIAPHRTPHLYANTRSELHTDMSLVNKIEINYCVRGILSLRR